MNKRIKRKIAKRINNKILNNERLTEFEIEHSMISKKLWKRVGIDRAKGPDMTVQSVVKLGDGNLVVSGQLVAEDTFEKYFKEKGCSDEEFADLADNLFVEPTMEEKMQMAIDSMNNFGSQLNPEPSAPVEEPNKWSKLKGKVKGWFGK